MEKIRWSRTEETHSSVNYSSVGNQQPTHCYQSKQKPHLSWTNQSHLEKTLWQSSQATSGYSGENVLCVGWGGGRQEERDMGNKTMPNRGKRGSNS